MDGGVLALDQGSHASRACVFDADGVMRAETSVAVATRYEEDSRVEQDPRELIDSLRTAAQGALAKCPELKVQHAGLATQRSTILCWSRASGAPLSPALSWQDRRHARWLAGYDAHAARVRAIGGLPLSPHYGVSKLRWCLDQLPAVQDANRAGSLQAGPLVAWLQTQLSGDTAAVDPANASRTLLYDSERLDWSEELLELFAIPRHILPAGSTTRADFGRLIDIGQDIQLSALSGDQSAVPFGLGPISEQTLYINLGTGAFLQQPLRQRPSMPEPLLGSVLYADAKQRLYTLEGTVNGAGSAVSTFCAERGLSESLLWPGLEQIPDEKALPVFLNAVGGLGSPWWNSHVQSAFLGEGDSIECFAAVIESVAFLIACNAAELRRQGAPAARVLLSGGLSRSNWLCTRLSALLAVPVERSEREASARGIAVLADPALSADWPANPTTVFEAPHNPALEERYARFQKELQQRSA